MKHDKPLNENFLAHLKSSGMVSPDSGIIVAVSGGVDSVVLLDLLMTVSEFFFLTLGVVHVNHKIRGSESDQDEQFVRDLCEEKGIPFFYSSLPLQSPDSSESWEAYARRFRYQFFEQIRKKGKYDLVATAHHADDQAETILMHVIEGSGIQGLIGIRERRSKIIRPLLPFIKQQVVEYARDKKLDYRTDPTNKDITYKRNYIRHELIPGILRLNPGFPHSISRLTKNIQELDNLVRCQVKNKIKKIVIGSENGILTLDAEQLTREPVMIQKRLIHHLLFSDFHTSMWRSPIWSNLEAFLEKSSVGDIFQLPNRWRMLKDRKQFILQQVSKKEINRENQEVSFEPGKRLSVTIQHHTLEMTVLSEPVEFSKDPCIELVDYSRLSGKKMTLRVWKSGDRMKPLGSGGFKKVSDILIDEKVNRFEKENQFVLITGDQIVWLCGIRLDERFKVRGDTRKVAQLNWSMGIS